MNLPENIKNYLSKSSKHKIENVIAYANNQLRKYRKQRKPKYGNLSKYITAEKFEAVFRILKNPKFKLIFWLMRKLALRIGEIVELNTKNIDIYRKQIFIFSEKSRMPDLIYLDDETTLRLKEWISENAREIKSSRGYIFFPDRKKGSKRLYLSPDMLRNKFRTACESAKIQIVYGKSANGHNLNLYTTHSLRHTGITDFERICKDIVLTQKYARHQNVTSTSIYVHPTEEDMRRAISSFSYDVFSCKPFKLPPVLKSSKKEPGHF